MPGTVSPLRRTKEERATPIHRPKTGRTLGQSLAQNLAAALSGESYNSYELFFDAVIDQLLGERPRERRLVNILGVVPSRHVFWRGNLQVIKDLLERIGLAVNPIFTEQNEMEALRRIPAAEVNLVFSPWSGIKTATRLEERFGTPYLVIPSVPTGPRDTSALLRYLRRKLNLHQTKVDGLIAEEEERVGRSSRDIADRFKTALPNPRFGVAADAGTAVALTRYGSNELGWLPEVAVVTDNPPREYRPAIVRDLTEGLAGGVKPSVFFEDDPQRISLLLRDHTLQLLLASSLEKTSAAELQAIPLSVGYPADDRLIIDRTYAGYRGGLALMEDVAFKCGGAL